MKTKEIPPHISDAVAEILHTPCFILARDHELDIDESTEENGCAEATINFHGRMFYVDIPVEVDYDCDCDDEGWHRYRYVSYEDNGYPTNVEWEG